MLKKFLSINLLHRLVVGGLTVLAVLGLFGLGAFLYLNFYQPLTDAPAIVLLRADVATVNLNVAAMNAALSFIDAATAPNTAVPQNPFILGQPPKPVTVTPPPQSPGAQTPTPQLPVQQPQLK